MSFFASRWVDAPEHVEDIGEGLPAGFRAGAAEAAIKTPGVLDVGLLVCDAPDAVSAARFTRSGVLAAPVVVTRDHTRPHALRAVVANSANANAATGEPGMRVALAMQQAAATATGIDPQLVGVASTGVIGVQLDGARVVAGIEAAAARLHAGGDLEFQDAIMTTDAFPKRASLAVTLASGVVRLSAQCKGAGMIEPAFATMLCFVQTDAAMAPETADLLLGVCVKRSFDRVSVDGQLSTNDTAILMCSGSSGVRIEPQTDDERRFGLALDALLRTLALMLVRDGEGSKRVGRVVVRGGEQQDAERCARAVANSPLVKTALHGADPNWGRIAQAVGMAMPHSGPLALDIAIEGMTLCRDGAAVAYDAAALDAAAAGDEIEYEVALDPAHPTGAEAEVFFSDFGHEYVTINAEYTT
ncbi:MAG TPA: bifunctional glutamate N-acetyltransferase/amino-acid acetyltransferase ArgJ [Solirubrobacteraceae bacterium]|jgi:glutamate N-acetyltransferase/amino-acid N-acetyltransferase|nr:bifunctional glutamate N-acetyltransferase/amino-acid acetyltransferase ArgJ [Solirubrobacteraceae bacterium]